MLSLDSSAQFHSAAHLDSTELWYQAPMSATVDIRKFKPAKLRQYNWRRGMACFGLGAVSGASNGLHETLAYHYSKFADKHPGADPQKWDPSISWRNKYEGGDVGKGPAYFGSTTFLVATTDWKHRLGLAHRAGLGLTGIVVVFGEKKPWWHYGLNMVSAYAGYSLGFNLLYNQIYGKGK